MIKMLEMAMEMVCVHVCAQPLETTCVILATSRSFREKKNNYCAVLYKG